MKKRSAPIDKAEAEAKISGAILGSVDDVTACEVYKQFEHNTYAVLVKLEAGQVVEAVLSKHSDLEELIVFLGDFAILTERTTLKFESYDSSRWDESNPQFIRKK